MPPKKPAGVSVPKVEHKKAPKLTPADKGCELIRLKDQEGLEQLLGDNKKMINKLEHKSGKNMLHIATEEGNLQLVDIIIDYGAKVNFRSKENQTAAMLAAFLKEDEILNYLIKKGANLTLQGRQGDTALHIAVRKGHFTTCDIILGNLKGIAEKQRLAEEEEEAERLKEEAAKLREEQGLDAEDEEEDEEEGDKDVADSPGKPVGIIDASGDASKAAAEGGVVVVEAGGEAPAAPAGSPGKGTAATAEGEEPKEEGEGEEEEEEEIENLEMEFDRKLILEDELNMKNDLCETPLGNAIKMQVWNIADLLIQSGYADLNAIGINGNTPLTRSAYDGRLDSVKWCVKQPSCDLNARTMNGETAVLIAIKQKHFDVAEFLIKEQGANIEDKDLQGNNALLLGAMTCHLPTIKFAVEVGCANIDATNNWGTSAAMFCSKTKSKTARASLEYVVQNKADLNIQDRNYRTALMFAARLDDIRRMQYLLEHGADPNIRDSDGKLALNHIPDHNIINERGNIEYHDENVKDYLHILDTYSEMIEYDAGAEMENIRGTDRWRQGDPVEVNYKGRGKWYKGKIARVCLGAAKGTFDVSIDEPIQKGIIPSLNPPRHRPEWLDRQLENEAKEAREIAWDKWVNQVVEETEEIRKQEIQQKADLERQERLEEEENKRKQAAWEAMTDEEREIILRRRAKDAAKARAQAREEAIARGEDPDALEEAEKKKEKSRQAAQNRAKKKKVK